MLTWDQNQCLKQTTQPCTTSSLPLLISCINSQCTEDSSTATSAANLALTYTPKKQYSCQQSFVPGSSEDAPSMQLTGDGACMTSPYEFQSLFVSASTTTDAGSAGAMTLQKMAQRCTMTLYADEGCHGEQTELDLSGVQGDQCIFESGRSAKLVCTPLRAPETRKTPSTCRTYRSALLTPSFTTASFTSVLSSLCTGPNAYGNGTNGTAPAANSTASPYSGSGSNATSSVEPALPSFSGQPYTGRASGDQVAKPSLIALVALFAVAVLML